MRSASVLVAWDVDSGRQLFDLGDLHANSFDIAPGSELLGVGTADGQVVLLDPRTGRQTAPPIQVATGYVGQVSFSPDGRSYAVASGDGTASVWDVRSSTRVGNPFTAPDAIPTVLFEPNGQLLIEALTTAVDWPMNVTTWEQSACRVAGRSLTRAEWHDVLPNRAYRPTCPAGTA
jgi:WD40 repeat protein